ncbi:MAG: phosphate signaling complex protein PhoU [Clostridium sp.]
MMRKMHNEKVSELNNDLLDMTALVETQIFDAIIALKTQNMELADDVIRNDDRVDDYQRQIEEKCIKFIATESPLAKDLRSVYTTSKVVTDLERIADHAVDICKIAKRVKGISIEIETAPLWEMVDIVSKMIGEAVEAYINCDEKAAYEICNKDDMVDNLYQGMFERILLKMSKDESLVIQGTQLLFASKYLERIGDHVTNICEWVIFSKKGNYVDLNE